MKHTKLNFADIPYLTLPKRIENHVIRYYYQTGYVESVLNVYHEGYLLKSFSVTLAEKQDALPSLFMQANEFYVSLQKAFDKFLKEETKKVTLFKDLPSDIFFFLADKPSSLHFKYNNSRAYSTHDKDFIYIAPKDRVTQATFTYGNSTAFDCVALNQFFYCKSADTFYCKIGFSEAYNLKHGHLVTDVHHHFTYNPLIFKL